MRSALRPARPPARWVVSSVLILLFTAATIALCILLGLRKYGDASKYFAERTLGTYASFALLVASAVVCFRIRKRHAHGDPLNKFWFWWGVLLCIVAADDLLRLHESIDRRIHDLFGWDRDHPVTDRIDDLIVACYAIPAAILWYRNRWELVRHRLMVQTLALAFVAFAVMSTMDFVMEGKEIEDSVKLVAEALILCAMMAAYYQPHAGQSPQPLTSAASPSCTPAAAPVDGGSRAAADE